MWILSLIALLLALPLHAGVPSGHAVVADELRIELDDLKYALHTTQVDLGLLSERLQKQGTLVHKVQDQQTPSSSQLASLEKKVLHLENLLEKMAGDVRAMHQSLHQTLSKIHSLETHISQHEKRLDEVTKLKGTLTSISKAIGQRSISDGGASSAKKTHQVKAGDSLGKIAHLHQIPIETLRKINHLSTDKILVGQELKLDEDPH
jgi:LysM repeat protein